VLTPKEMGMKGAISKAKELVESNPKYWMPQQFQNSANPEIHTKTTALEILNDFPDGFDYLITGVGTGGHITGVAEILKNKFPKLKVFAVEPEDSPVLSGGVPGAHQIQGIGAGFIPEVMKKELLDGVITVAKEEAFEFAIRAAKQEALFAGISTGASLAAVNKLSKNISGKSRILTFNYDTGERYLSVADLF